MATNRKKTTKKAAAKKAPSKPLGALNNHAGLVISLNMKSGAFFGVGTDDNMKVWLSPAQWHGVVPDNLTEAEALQITIALHAERIIEGKKWTPAIDKAVGTIEEYVKAVKTARVLDEKTKKIFRDLVARGSDGGYTALEILNACISYEREARGRQPWLIFLQAGLDTYQGPVQLVEDFPDDPDSYEVTIDQTRGVVLADTSKKDDLRIPVVPAGLETVEPQVAQAELDRFLN